MNQNGIKIFLLLILIIAVSGVPIRLYGVQTDPSVNFPIEKSLDRQHDPVVVSGDL